MNGLKSAGIVSFNNKFFHKYLESVILIIYIKYYKCLSYNYTIVNCVDLKFQK